MAFLGCNGKSDCTGLAIIASVIIGIITAFLRLTGVITATPAFLWVVFGIAVVYLPVILLAVSSDQAEGSRGCVAGTLPVLLAGILGTILLSLILLAIDFVATSVIGAIITGALLLFFSLTVTTTACLIKAIVRCNG